MLEKVEEAKACKQARKSGWKNCKIGVNGKPDRLFWQRKVYAWVEFKIRPNKPTPLQQKKIDELRDDGENVTVAYSVEECLAFLRSLEWWRNDYVDTQGP